MSLVNPSPVVHSTHERDEVVPLEDDDLQALREDIYDIIRTIKDPEHPYTLEQLNVVKEDAIYIDDKPQQQIVLIEFIPTVPHCSLAAIIGLSVRHKLARFYPHIKVDLRIKEGTHNTADQINKQLNDKERVKAALDNPALLDIVLNLTKDPSEHEY